jgi:hypothetical protein
MFQSATPNTTRNNFIKPQEKVMSDVISKKVSTFIIATIAVAALGFASALPAQALPAEATLSDVEDCEHLGSLHGHSGYGRLVGTHWEGIAKGRALRKAHNTAATHVIWDHSHGRGAYHGHVYGDMYACE